MPDPSFYRPSHSEFGHLDPAVTERLVTIQADDGGRSRAVVYVPPGAQPRTVVLRTHPSGDLLQHWAAPYWTGGGFAFASFLTRYVNNYSTCVHERIVLDVAALVRFLKQDMGFERVVLHGQSGGASCLAFYQAEANTAVGSRISAPPGGGAPDLNKSELIPADGLVFVAGHPGQGKFLQDVIDPSVIDENDQLATDWTLDMYDERNGWRPPPEVSHYDADWLTEYRAAQERRVRRLDALAREALARRDTARELLVSQSFDELPARARRDLEREAQLERVLVIHRTEANPAYTDQSIDPSDRGYGSIQGERPHVQNYGGNGFGRIVTAEAWLSTWSGTSSNAYLARNLPRCTQPTLFVFPTADQDIYPGAFKRQLEQSAASDKTELWLPGVDHFFRAGGPKAYQGDVRADAMKQVVDWTRERFAP